MAAAKAGVERAHGTLQDRLAKEMQYDKVLYLVDPSRENQKLAGKRVTVIDYPGVRQTHPHTSRGSGQS